MAYVIARDLGLEYPIQTNTKSFRDNVLAGVTGGLIKKGDTTVTVQAINGVNFQARDGDRIGIVGHNGAGKSSLLRVLAGIYPATQGSLSVDGTVASLSDLGFGINLEETGWENIDFLCRFQGYSRETIKARSRDIGAYTELGDFLNMPVRTYSTGMQARLSFALTFEQQSDILLLDEVMGAGDQNFQNKTQKDVEARMDTCKILFLASHANSIIRDWCNKVIWMEHGHVQAFGETEEVLNNYESKVVG